MSRFAVKIQCPNSECLYADNHLGQPVCDRCQSPLTYRYLWAVGVGAAQHSPSSLLDCRYAVINSQIWLDTQPGLAPKVPPSLSEYTLPYLHLYPHRLHLPELFGVYQPTEDQPPVLLLENAPIDGTGQLLPLLEMAWASAPAVRQLNWLCQMLQLWQPLKTRGVATSLLISENLHVEGWRLRLRELVVDQTEALIDPWQTETADTPVFAFAGDVGHTPQPTVMRPSTVVTALPLTSTLFNDRSAAPSLRDLAEIWQSWVEDAHPAIREALHYLCELLQATSDTQAGFQTIADHLNQLLLEQAAALPLQIELAGASTTGTLRSHNEDACYPNLYVDSQTIDSQAMIVLPRVGIVCDGIGGHEGGEVASQLALRSLQLQIRTWLAELMVQSDPLPPVVIEEQLIEIVRVVNNVIAAQNNTQGREQRQRMGTTLVMAVQPPQTLQTERGEGSTHELYLVHVGDSRAYWLTANSCQRLTVDDDVASREVQAGRSLYSLASHRSDATALTQALGTREADRLKITVQRFVLDEDGILLLCSDGLSDNGLVEQFWQSMTQPVLKNMLSLKAAVQEWIELANRQNGHDNASVVLMQCRLTDEPHLFEPNLSQSNLSRLNLSQSNQSLAQAATSAANPDTDLTESAKALLYDDAAEANPARKAAVLPKRADALPKTIDTWITGLGIAALMFVFGALAVALWRELAPTGFHPSHPSAPESSTDVEATPEAQFPSSPTN